MQVLLLAEITGCREPVAEVLVDSDADLDLPLGRVWVDAVVGRAVRFVTAPVPA